MSSLSFALTAAAQIAQPQSTVLPLPYIDGYIVCIAATARAEAEGGAGDEAVLREAQHSCGFIADEAIRQIRQNPPDRPLAERFSRDYAIAEPATLTIEALLRVGDARARKIIALVRAEHEGK